MIQSTRTNLHYLIAATGAVSMQSFFAAIGRFALVLGVSLFTYYAHAGQASPRLYIFFPIASRPHVVHKSFTAACPDIETTVFGRHADFMARLAFDPPDAVLTRPQLLAQIPTHRIRLRGQRKGKTEELMALLSPGSPPDPDSLDRIAVGAVDFLGKEGMERLLMGMFRPTPRLKRVVKVEDLIPLLNFGMVNAILAFPHDLEYLNRLSAVRFTATYFPEAKTGIAALATLRNRQDGRVVAAMQSLPADLMHILGIDGWKLVSKEESP